MVEDMLHKCPTLSMSYAHIIRVGSIPMENIILSLIICVDYQFIMLLQPASQGKGKIHKIS